MKVKILDVENEVVIDAILLTKLTVFSTDIGIVALPDETFAAVLLKYGLKIKDTVSKTMQDSFASWLLKSPNIKHWCIIGAETGAAGFCEKLKISYPLNPEYR